jgi:hypothetical protein
MKTPSSLPMPGARLAGALALLLAACGNSEPTASTPPQPSETPSATPATPPPAEPEAAPTASASASAKAAAKPPKSGGGGRPAVLKSDANEISDTFGSSPASKLELGAGNDIATLRLPEEGLHTATIVTFKIERSGKSGGAQIGKIYSIKSVLPPAATPEQIESNGPPFILEMPAGNKKDVNLAIGIEDDKGKLKWTIVAPKSVDDSRHVAVFELSTLPSGFLHLTSKAPSGK